MQNVLEFESKRAGINWKNVAIGESKLRVEFDARLSVPKIPKIRINFASGLVDELVRLAR